MPESKGIDLNSFLENPEVKKVITPFTDDFQERLNFQPRACDVFKSPVTKLESDRQYEFDIHPATKEALPHIINNTVQRIIGIEKPDANLEKNYTLLALLFLPSNTGFLFYGLFLVFYPIGLRCLHLGQCWPQQYLSTLQFV